MGNDFIYSDDIKRYHTWNYHLRHKFGCKVFKVSLNGGFTCPNIDGTKGYGGCTYCSSAGSGDFAGNIFDPLRVQFDSVRQKLHEKWHEAKYIPYFQANTNTYAPVERLRELYEEVLLYENVVGLSIATRADCIDDDVFSYLCELRDRTYLIVELGLQSIYDKTGTRINRCHTYSEFLECYNKLQNAGINVCVHLIDGLPGEDFSMMLNSAKIVGSLRPQFIKLHLLHIIKGTQMENEYINGDITPLSLEEYVDIITEQLRFFPKETVIQRITGDGGRDILVAPKWSLKKFVVLNEIDKAMIRKNIYQGDLVK